MRAVPFVVVLAAGLTSAVLAYGQVPATGTFIAKQACAATQSIRNRSNSGGTSLQPGRAYPLVGKNKPDATFLQIVVDGSRRWVDIQCGAADAQAEPATSARATYVLALSWEPAFCSGHSDKPECHDTASGSARSLSLHGLWPQPRGRAYCGVDPSLIRQGPRLGSPR